MSTIINLPVTEADVIPFFQEKDILPYEWIYENAHSMQLYVRKKNKNKYD